MVKAAAYFLAWFIGINLPGWVERLLLGDIPGRPDRYADGPAAGVVAAAHILHPIGFVILVSHLILFAIFVRFGLRYRWVLWPFASGLFWRMFMERL